MTTVLEVTNLSKSFGSIEAVRSFNLRMSPGEVVALVGDNGAGKSTIVKMLSGIVHPTAGAIHIQGQQQELKSPNDAKAAGIETVLQDLALVTQQSVYSNLFLGRELKRKGLPLLDHGLMFREAQQLFKDLNVNIPDVKAPAGSLSGGQRQAIAIARAAKWGKTLVIMDEPTAALGVAETAKVEELIHRLSSLGTAVLIVSHNLEQVFRVSSRISIMRRGTYVGEVKTGDVTTDDVVGLITGSR